MLTTRSCFILNLAWIFFGATSALAAPPEAVSFFRTPQSLFPSGQTSPQSLDKKTIGSEFLYRYFIQSGGKKQWVSANQMARDIDLSEKVLYQEKEYTLNDVQGHWAQIELRKEGRKEWVPFNDLIASPEDLGMALTLIPTSLREGPTWSSNLITTMPGRSHLKILEVKDSWLKVTYSNVTPPLSTRTGFVDLNNVLLKADFAEEIMDQNSEWQKVKYREGYFLQLENKRTIPLNKVKLWKTNHSMAIVIESDEGKKLLLRQTAEILKTEAQAWNISQLKDHGKVYWKRPTNLTPASSAQLILRKEDLLKREVFSVAWSPQNSSKGLVSSHGIFVTFDGGETWSYLPRFKNENHPVSISPDGVWYVGTMKSKDLGKSFTNYLRIDSIAHLIQSQSLRPPRVLKISKIDFKNSNMEIWVETGAKRLRLATKSHKDLITNWDLLN
jgi:hypothetical protein